MAHFAKLDENNVVQEVIVIANGAVNNLEFPESEPIGVDFCKLLYGADTVWKQTSYNASFRKHYATIGMIYNADIDAFIVPKPFQSWTLNPETGKWDAPVLYPDDGCGYNWEEETQTWKRVYVYEIFGLPPPDQLVP